MQKPYILLKINFPVMEKLVHSTFGVLNKITIKQYNFILVLNPKLFPTIQGKIFFALGIDLRRIPPMSP